MGKYFTKVAYGERQRKRLQKVLTTRQKEISMGIEGTQESIDELNEARQDALKRGVQSRVENRAGIVGYSALGAALGGAILGRKGILPAGVTLGLLRGLAGPRALPMYTKELASDKREMKVLKTTKTELSQRLLGLSKLQ